MGCIRVVKFFFFKRKTAYEIRLSLVGSEMCIMDSFYTLEIGDLLFTGTPSGVGPVAVGQHLQGYIQERKVLDFNVR